MYYHRAHIHWWAEKWWFSDETEQFNGPFATWDEAALESELYCLYVLNGSYEDFIKCKDTQYMAP